MTEPAVDVLDAKGHVVRLRRCRPSDAYQIRTLLTALSPQSRYLRFFSSGTSIVEPELARLTRPPGPDHAAVVAQLGADIVGIGSYERLDGADSAELAVLVAERWRGRGIGTLLLLRLARLAADVPEIAELDLDPVIAGPDGVTAVDVHLRLAHPAEAPDPYNRTLRTAR